MSPPAKNVVLDAENDGVIVNSAGGIPSGANVGVGLSGALTFINEADALDEGGADEEEFDGLAKTHAFIGDALETVGPTGTGGETGFVCGRDILVDADSSMEAYAIALAGAATTESAGAAGVGRTRERLHVPGSASPATSHSTSSTRACRASSRHEFAVAGDLISVEARDQPLSAAGAGAVVFAGHVGIGGSLAFNGSDAITRAYTQDVTLWTPDLIVDAEVDAK
jgi:hypothetical protein